MARAVATDDNIDALELLSRKWTQGFRDANVDITPFTDKAQEYMLRVARKGHWRAHYAMAESLVESHREKAMVWYTLSAAQGFSPAQLALGESMLPRDPLGTDPYHFGALFRLEKAALQNEVRAIAMLSMALLDVKARIFDDVNAVGYSVLPEASFWYAVTPEMYGIPRPPLLEQSLVECAQCHQHGTVKQCSRCKGVSYCKPCQARHWKLGHQVDCAVVETLRVAFTPMCHVGCDYPVCTTEP